MTHAASNATHTALINRADCEVKRHVGRDGKNFVVYTLWGSDPFDKKGYKWLQIEHHPMASTCIVWNHTTDQTSASEWDGLADELPGIQC